MDDDRQEEPEGEIRCVAASAPARPGVERAFGYGYDLRGGVQMEDQRSYRDVVRPLAAVVLPSGEIEVELHIPEQDEPIETTIHATGRSKKSAPTERRDV